MRIPMVSVALLFSVCLGAQAREPGKEVVELPLSARQFLSNLSSSKAEAPAIDWIKLRNGKELLGTKESQGQFGRERVLLMLDRGETLVSFSKSSSPEMVTDTNSPHGLQPYLLKKDPTSDRIIAKPSGTCASCHTKEFTFIWGIQMSGRFSDTFTKSLSFSHGKLAGVKLEREDGSWPPREIIFQRQLIQRASRNLFQKIQSRHPRRFANHLSLLFKMLMSCEGTDGEWAALLNEIKKESPGIAKNWEAILKSKNLSPHVLRPLVLLHYLGVAPQNIFLFRPLSADEDVFQSVEFFKKQFTEKQKNGDGWAEGERIGPLGAYGGSNDDIRSYLAILIAQKFFPELTLQSGKKAHSLKAGVIDGAFHEGDANLVPDEFNTYAIYPSYRGYTSNPICEQLKHVKPDSGEVLSAVRQPPAQEVRQTSNDGTHD